MKTASEHGFPAPERPNLHGICTEIFRPTPASFWSSVDRSGPAQACWPWLGRVDSAGHGVVSVTWGTERSAANTYGSRPAQRLALLFSGTRLIDGLVVYPGCGNRLCCNPGHLVQGTKGEAATAMRRTCRRGHPWTGEEVSTDSRGYRRCLVCHREREAERKARRVAEGVLPKLAGDDALRGEIAAWRAAAEQARATRAKPGHR